MAKRCVSSAPSCDQILIALDLYLTVGTQVTSIFTPTVTMSVVETPTITQTTTTTSTDVETVGPFSTVTVPSGTAKKIKTVTPKRVTTTSTKVMSKYTHISSPKRPSEYFSDIFSSLNLPRRPSGTIMIDC
jgi:hypothetical protein